MVHSLLIIDHQLIEEKLLKYVVKKLSQFLVVEAHAIADVERENVDINIDSVNMSEKASVYTSNTITF